MWEGRGKEYHEKLCAYKFDNLEEIDQFFVRHNLLKLTKGEMNNMKRSIPIKSLNQYLITFQNRKHQVQMDSLVNSTKYVRKKLYKFSTIFFQKKKAGGIFHNSQQPTRLLSPWNFPGKSTGLGCHFLLQGIFPTQGLNLGLPHCRQTLYRLSHRGSHLCEASIHNKKYRTILLMNIDAKSLDKILSNRIQK